MNDQPASPAPALPWLSALLEAQRSAAAREEIPDRRMRAGLLQRLEQALLARRGDLVRTLDADFGGRSPAETLFVEVFGLVDEIRHTRRQLRRWMRPRRVPGNPQTRPGRASIHYRPLGVIGVMGAYNYPLYLSLSPAIGAIAAGNRVMIKPSEQAPLTGALIAELVAAVCPPEQVCVVNGGVELSRAFAALPFDHLVFTGSGRVGRQVLRQAADRLMPVTLELGGKSPAIIAPGFDIAEAATKIMYAKLLNAGQTCIAPDHVWVPQAQVGAFVEAAAAAAARFHPQLVANPQYTRMISAQAHARLQQWVDEAQARGAKVRSIHAATEDFGEQNRVFPPTLVTDCPPDTALMQQEIFGPVLPVCGYQDLDHTITRINAGPSPLAAYLFDLDSARSQRAVDRLICGGITVNGCLYHVGQHNLPLGGVGDSGIGAYHGFHGFERFSCQKAVFHASRLLPDRLMHPPYGRTMEWLLGWLLHGRPVRESIARVPE
jgi:coniferyl-aldehyde dehydrogenase